MEQSKADSSHHRAGILAAPRDVTEPERPQVILPRRALTLRAIVLGILLIPANVYVLLQLEVLRYESWPTILALSMNSLFVLFVLCLLNWPVARLAPRFALSQGELLTVYICLNLSSVIASADFFQILLYHIGYAGWAASPENRWGALFLQWLPDWLFVKDTDVLTGFYDGKSSFFHAANVRAWAVPALVWGGFAFTLLGVMLCINVIFRKQWSDHERLSFPLVYLPVEMTATPRFFANRNLWIGFGVASFIAVVNGLSRLHPGWPSLPTKLSVELQSRPWSALGAIPICFYPFVTGISLVIPTDLSFSVWLFYLFQRAQLVLTAALGWDVQPDFPHLREQSAGALAGISLFTLWIERRYLAAVVRKALGRSREPDDAGEPMSYRAALAGLILGMGALGTFAIAIGMSPWLAPVFFGIYFIVAVGLTRLRAELGTGAHDIFFVGPERLLMSIGGSRAFARSDLQAMAILYWFNREYGGHPMPHLMESLRMGQSSQMNMGHLARALLVICAVSIFAFFVVGLTTMYAIGAGRADPSILVCYGGEAPTWLARWLTVGEPRSLLRAGAGGFGVLVSWALLTLRLRLPGWPLHPLGLAVASTWYLNTATWFSIFLGWLAKVVILRYGGRRGYQLALPVFLGMVLGDCFWGAFWLIFGVIVDAPTYSVWF